MFSAVCGPPDLPAGAVVHLVWEPGGMERQQDGLEAARLRGHLPHHASPLPGLLDRTKVKGDDSMICAVVESDNTHVSLPWHQNNLVLSVFYRWERS